MTTNNMIDLNTCVKGQKLKLRNGDIVEYDRKLECASIYPHQINGNDYTDDGRYLTDREDSWDVVKIFPLKTLKPEIDLNTCVPGQKVKLRDETIGTYNGLINENRLYKHAVDGYSYTHNGRFWAEDDRISNRDVMKILPMENSKPVIDLRTCVPGQKVRLRYGAIDIYQRATDRAEYPHQFCSGRIHTDEGYYWFDKTRSDNDVIEILPVEEELDKPRSDNDVMEILPMEEEPAKTEPELTHSITDQIDVTSPDHVSIIPHEHGVTISIKKGLTTVSWRHYNH